MLRRVFTYCVLIIVTAVVVTFVNPLAALRTLAQPAQQTDCRNFPQTGKTVCGRFLQYWDTHGGLAQQGYPISDEFTEVSELNGQSYTVQYFERAVFEYHPENKPPYDVLLSQLGRFEFQRRYPNGEPTVPGVAHDALGAVKLLPLNALPAQVSRGDNAESGTLTLALPIPGLQVSTQVKSNSAGQIGQVTSDGQQLIFNFTRITYDVAPISLPNGHTIGPQTIELDPSKPSTMHVNLTTGAITRDFHWILRATNAKYNGQPTLPLGDTGTTEVQEAKDLGGNRFSLRLLTHWKSTISLSNWSVDNVTLPGGPVDAHADFLGTYQLDFNK